MKRVAVRFYAADNLGDDLFLKVLAERYTTQFVYRRYSRGGTLSRLPSLRGVGGRWSSRAYILLERLLGVGSLATLRLARGTEALIHVGGSLFIDDGDSRRWERESRFYRRLGRPYYILGLNFGPARTPAFIQRVADIFKNAQDVCFRDRASYEIFEGIKSTRVATDVVFAMDVTRLDPTNERSVVISVIDARRRFDASVAELYLEAVGKLAAKLAGDGYRVVLMSFCEREGDLLAAEEILRKLPDATRDDVSIYDYQGEIDEALAVIARADLVVASRFHANVLGLLLDKKIISLAYSRKTTDFLTEIGFEGPIFDIKNLDVEELCTIDIRSIPRTDISAQVHLAEHQFDSLDKELERRASRMV
ncbi:polysaccharide pyruvyl transferase family protein [Microbacterium sp. AGC85]